MSLDAVHVLECLRQAGGRPVARADLAEVVNASLATLNRNLNALVAAGLVERIRHGWYQIAAAAAVTPVLANGPILLTSPWDGIVARSGIEAGLEEVLAVHGVAHHRLCTNDDGDYMAAVLEACTPDIGGLVCFSHDPLPPELVDQMQAIKRPLVQLGLPETTARVDTVEWNACEVYACFARTLIAQGCAEIIFLRNDQRDRHWFEHLRYVTVRSICDTAGIPCHEVIIHKSDLPAGLKGHELYERLTTAAHAGRRIGLINHHFSATIAILTLIVSHGFRLREDILFASLLQGFTVQQFGWYTQQMLLRAEQPGHLIGRAAAWRIIDRLRGNKSAAQAISVRCRIEIYDTEREDYTALEY